MAFKPVWLTVGGRKGEGRWEEEGRAGERKGRRRRKGERLRGGGGGKRARKEEKRKGERVEGKLHHF